MHRTLQKFIEVIAVTSLLSASGTAPADTNDTVIGRYLIVANQATTEQTDLLQQTFQVKFPYQVQTIGDAMKYLLRFSGYSLIADNYLPNDVRSLLVKPLPEVDRSFGPMTLQNGLLTLAGQPFGLLADPVHRLISFRLKPQYQSLYQASHKILF